MSELKESPDSDERVCVSLSLPKSLVSKLDEMRAKERRSRSNFVEVLLAEKQEEAAV